MTYILKYLDHINIEQLMVNIINKIISLVLIFILFLIIRYIINLAFEKALNNSFAFTHQTEARKKTLLKLSHNMLNYCLYFFLAYWVLSILGVPVSSLLAGAGIAGVPIGLGAQGFLSDVVNGFFILFENQFEVGDTVNIVNIDGIIANVGIRTTQIKGFDGTLHFIQNRNITVVSNKSRGNMRALIDIPLYTTANLEQITSIIEKINQTEISKFPEIVGEPSIIGPQTTTNGQFVFRVAIYTTNGEQFNVYHEFYQKYQSALLKANIPLPTAHIYSQQNN
ncbi:mechanosensitive ion channel family protein [Streptococcus urinalis]|uniref:mechanosensitive ion channel family protein n=1 Tax=Streptococcus urinalis TaxID=149016 RepID=UPI000F6B76A3|nr:mechanosensitive ion channel family protein [Streptococcus urinalis]VEF32687.1 mechanosensitive ion channel family protein [Streptococcus urinalis]